MELTAASSPQHTQILTSDALLFLEELSRKFEVRRQELLAKRRERQRAIDGGAPPDFLAGAQSVRRADWKVSTIPRDLEGPRGGITRPGDREMLIHAVNSPAR